MQHESCYCKGRFPGILSVNPVNLYNDAQNVLYTAFSLSILKAKILHVYQKKNVNEVLM